MAKNKVKETKVDKVNKPVKKRKLNPIVEISIKFLIVLGVLGTTVNYFDSIGYFNPNNVNNHTKKKWDAFYDFTTQNNVDILLLGNSHLYTGINPKNLSNALGGNAFILASPGTNIADTYYSLLEALEVTKPQIVVIETYGINAFNPYELEGSALSDQFKSFSARKNVVKKLESTPYLFTMDDYFYAWSNTVRNHDYLYTNPEQLEKNVAIYEKERFNPTKKKFYLGRYVRFQTGLTDSLINLYKEKGAPVDGKDYETNEYTQQYVNEIIKLCEQEKIQLVFLTLPMFEDHVTNYDAWKNKLVKLIGPATDNWIDMQDSVHYDGFDKNSFENTYNLNQHMTFAGSLLATYKLADYIKSKNLDLINRKGDPKWRKTFYAEEGFFQNNLPDSTDALNKVLFRRPENDTNTNNVVSHISLINGKSNNSVIAVLDRDSLNGINLKEKMLQVNTTVKLENGTTANANMNMTYDKFHSLDSNYVYFLKVKKVEVLSINKLSFIDPINPAVDSTAKKPTADSMK